MQAGWLVGFCLFLFCFKIFHNLGLYICGLQVCILWFKNKIVQLMLLEATNYS